MIAFVVAMDLVIAFVPFLREMNRYVLFSLQYGVFLLPVVCFLALDQFDVLRGMKTRAIGVPTMLWTVLLTILLLPVTVVLNLLTQFVVPNNVSAALMESTTAPLWVSLVYLAVIPALVEEYIFRGVLVQYLRHNGLLKTALLTGLMFALSHMDLNQFLYTLMIGIFYVYLDEAAGSIYCSMLSHFLVNGFNILIIYLTVSNVPESMVGLVNEAEQSAAFVEGIPIIYWIMLAAVAVVCFILAVIVVRHIAKIRGNEKKYQEARSGRDAVQSRDKKVFSVYLLIGCLIPIVYVFMIMILSR